MHKVRDEWVYPMSHATMSVSAPVRQGPKVSFERERGVYAIHVTRDVAHVVVVLDAAGTRTGRIAQIFRTLADAQVPIFLVKLHRTAVSFALVGTDVARAEAALHAVRLTTRTRLDLAVVAVLAASMRAVSGVMVDVSDALYLAGARLYGTGDSHDSVQCLIEEKRADAAVQQLRTVFQLDQTAVRETNLTKVTP